jgi:hypothetical protein
MENNEMLLYQHSPRCPLVLQRFLDKNPEYWCLVPMFWRDAIVDDDVTVATTTTSSSSSRKVTTAAEEANAIYRAVTARQLQPESPTFAKKPKFFAEIFTNSTRSIQECIWLARGVPKPPTDYRFSRQQIEEQIDFFKFKKEARIVPSNLIDCYRYTIVAVCKCHYFEIKLKIK